jgi:hypothetical protein
MLKALKNPECLVHQYRYFSDGWETLPSFDEIKCSGCDTMIVGGQFDEGMYDVCADESCRRRFCKINNCLCGRVHRCANAMIPCDEDNCGLVFCSFKHLDKHQKNS